MCLLVPASTGLSSQDASNTASRPGASAAMVLKNCLMTELDWRKLVGRRFTKSLLAKEHQLGPQGNYRNPCGCKNRGALWNGCTSNKVLHQATPFAEGISDETHPKCRLLWLAYCGFANRRSLGEQQVAIAIEWKSVCKWLKSERTEPSKIVKFAHWTHR